jgi:hypothetical protein
MNSEAEANPAGNIRMKKWRHESAAGIEAPVVARLKLSAGN